MDAPYPFRFYDFSAIILSISLTFRISVITELYSQMLVYRVDYQNMHYTYEWFEWTVNW